MFHIKTVRAIETEQYCKNIIGNMKSTEIFLVLTLVLCQIKLSLSGKSDESKYDNCIVLLQLIIHSTMQITIVIRKQNKVLLYYYLLTVPRV